jgi:hypothetical protein
MSSTRQLTIVPRREPMGAEPDEIAARRLSLREHVEGVEAIADAIEQLDDETLTQDARDELSAALIEALAGTRKKVDTVASTLALFESLRTAAVTERDRLARRVEFYARQSERLETYVLAVLSASNLNRLDGETSTLMRRLNPPSVVVDDESAIPTEFLRWPPLPPEPPPVPDKAAIKKAILGGNTVYGCRLERSVRLVRS